MNIHQRILQVMKSVSYIQKEQKRGMQYSVVSHDAVTAKLRPAIIEAGIVYYPVSIELKQEGNRTECLLNVRFVNADKPEDYIETVAIGYGIDTQDKGPGKAISYAIKYALLKTFALETGDDPDLDQSVVHTPTDRKPTPPPRVSMSEVSESELRDTRWEKAEEFATTLQSQISGTTSVAELEQWFEDSKAKIAKLKESFPAISKKVGETFNKKMTQLKEV